ncbi:RNA ligase (ATP) [Arsenicibacter rosenii]|uniref:RNA ligase n=1 Tax=Arsenicibacter rosenii TaxID=1750698 RepID=A0A1S2VGT4_9BACT|nr:RNA ligase (ATP) [Arsenicibacter rosenii]OIN57943.1 RNA ligase [Arsenicibacter rosenii]
MRKLASIQRINALTPIEGADAIERASVLGWQLVVKKGEFQAGDLAVYCEIDSLLPDRPEFDFLKPRGMRIRTVRLRGQVSQGICFPLAIVPAGAVLEEGADCTELLGVRKYEPPMPACLDGVAKGRFPSFIPKTDETRVQVLQEVLDTYLGERCYVTEKLDGSSATYFVNNNEFGVCSRNLELLEDQENSFWKVARQLDIENKLRATGKNIALQGELVGEGIQGNKLKLRGQTVYFFNAFDIDRSRYFSFQEFVELLTRLDLPMVPVLAVDYALQNSIDTIVGMATRKSTLCKEAWAEGIIIRPYLTQTGGPVSDGDVITGRVSFKAINPEFLLKYGE